MADREAMVINANKIDMMILCFMLLLLDIAQGFDRFDPGCLP
jgi:hypothetical protein